jgi:hypothetical protein
LLGLIHAKLGHTDAAREQVNAFNASSPDSTKKLEELLKKGSAVSPKRHGGVDGG